MTIPPNLRNIADEGAQAATNAAAIMPTSGSARRRAKAARNRALALDCEVAWAFRNDRTPPSAIAVSVCGCGRRSWLMPGATDEDRESFDRDNADHGDYCEGGA